MRTGKDNTCYWSCGIGASYRKWFNLGIVKPLVARPRPLNNPDLQGIVVAVNHYMADGYSFFLVTYC